MFLKKTNKKKQCLIRSCEKWIQNEKKIVVVFDMEQQASHLSCLRLYLDWFADFQFSQVKELLIQSYSADLELTVEPSLFVTSYYKYGSVKNIPL